MTAPAASICQLSVPKRLQLHQHLHQSMPTSRGRPNGPVIRSCKQIAGPRPRTEKSYYELLGVSVTSNPKEIREAYRKLQKKHHPDIAGSKGHEYTLQLNEAYRVLMRDDLRRDYDASTSIGHVGEGFGKGFSGLACSSWRGPRRPQALFVDENACIGCKECVYHASNTFAMDEALGHARVKVQYGDENPKIEVSVESCPVNCIHWVNSDDLPVLEYLIQPQPKEGYGVFGGGWETTPNIFMAAESFKKQLKQQAQDHQRTGPFGISVEEETPSQAVARENASFKLQMERLSESLNWARVIFGFNRVC